MIFSDYSNFKEDDEFWKSITWIAFAKIISTFIILFKWIAIKYVYIIIRDGFLDSF